MTIGIVLFLSASSFFIDKVANGQVTLAGVALFSWLLAEFFTRKRRRLCPASCFFDLHSHDLRGFGSGFGTLLPQHISKLDPDSPGVALAALGAAACAALHYWRFRVPITIAAGAAVLCLVPIALAAILLPAISSVALPATIFLCGVLVFALAMHFDMSDPQRQTRRTDIAFWLHLLAAPLIVQSLFLGFFHTAQLDRLDMVQSILILATFILLGLVAIIIDRRAILVSGLIYAGYAFSTLIQHSGFGTNAVPTTLLVLGIFVLLLSVFWQPLRRISLALIPPRFTRYLPHPLTMGS